MGVRRGRTRLNERPTRPTATELARLAEEATAATAGLEVRALVDVEGGAHLLLLAPSEGEPIEARILVCTEGDRARIHLAPARPPPRPKKDESAFTRDATPLVVGTRVAQVEAVPGDRTVIVRLLGPEGEPRRLVAELFGSAPNLLLVDEGSVIRALKRHRKGARPLAVGAPYVPAAARPGPTGDDAAVAAPFTRFPSSPADATFAAAHPWSAAVDAAFHPLDRRADQDAERDRIRDLLARARAKADGLVRNLERQAAAGEEAGSWRRRGDLLSAAYHRLRRGLSEIEVDDFAGGTEVVPLDPALDARGNVEAYYKRARKLERAGEGAAERLRAARARAEELRSLDERFQRAVERGDDPPDEARRLLEASPRGGRRSAPARAPKRPRAEDPGFRHFTLRSGHVVLVGKSQRDNDRLTLQVARGNDVWMHVHGDAGSHVVLRTAPGKTPSLEDLLDAASLAVHFSKRRGARRAEVVWTARKHVRKRKGMPPGAVQVDRHETLLVEDSESRARALLETSRDSVSSDEPLP